jgi:multimeric flavodoxin WrbA
MKALMINGSPKADGCIGTALKIAAEVFAENGIESEIFHIGNKDIRGCIACLSCRKTGKCVFNDIVNETYAKLQEADGIIVGTPVYFGNPNGTVLSFLQRLFYSYPGNLKMMPAAAVISNRRGGSSASFEAMNQFFTMREMPVVSSSYWNDVHGYTAEDVYKDEEGVQTIRNLALNMVFMIRAIQGQKEKTGLPDTKKEAFTNMIR